MRAISAGIERSVSSPQDSDDDRAAAAPLAEVMTRHSRSDLARRTLHAAKWNYLGVIARVVMQLVAQIVLARLVGPAEFGYYSMVFMAVSVAYVVAEFGLSSAIVQSSALGDSDVNRIWSRLVACSLLGSGAMYLLAEPIAALVQIPEAATYMRWAPVPLTVQLLSAVSLAVLRKRLDFKRIQLAQIGGMLIGQIGLGFLLAWALHSAWAILFGWTAQLLIAWLIMYLKVRHQLSMSFSPLNTNIRKFGLGAWSANIANWSIENLHIFLAGRFFGATTLGFYSVGSNLVRYPTNHLVTTLQTVIFPASAAAHAEGAGIKGPYLAVLSLVLLVTVPMFVLIALLSEPLIRLLYGPAWSDVACIIQPLALAMPFHSVTAVSGPVLWGVGRVGREANLQWATILIFLALAYFSGFASAIALSWIVLLTYMIRAVLIANAVASVLDIGTREALSWLRGTFVVALVSAGGSLLSLHLVPNDHGLLQLVIGTCMVIVISVVIIWRMPRLIISAALAQAIMRFEKKLPASFVSRLVKKSISI